MLPKKIRACLTSIYLFPCSNKEISDITKEITCFNAKDI
jgi:hypothetical protein